MKRCVKNVYNGGSNTDAEDAYINMWVLTLVLRLRTMRITSLHPPPLACTGLSDNLSSPALFPLQQNSDKCTNHTLSGEEKSPFNAKVRR